jgi:hypothetical protein
MWQMTRLPLLLLFLTLMGCSRQSPQPAQDTWLWIKTDGPAQRASIYNVHYERGSNTFYAAGTLRNDSSDELENVYIQCSFYGANTNMVGAWWETIDDIGPGETWDFKVAGAPGAKRFKIDGAMAAGQRLDIR